MDILLNVSMILSAAITVALVTFVKYRNTKDNYISKTSNKAWFDLVKKCLASALIASLIVCIVNCFVFYKGSYFVVYVTFITTYCGVQAYYTDRLIYEIDRHLLRLAYFGNFLATVGYTIIAQPDMRTTQFAFATYFLLAFIFVFFNLESFGPSDCRAMAVTLPFSSLIFGASMGLALLVGILLISYAWLKHKELKNGKSEMTPIGPIFLIPYTFVFIAAPVVIEVGKILSGFHIV